ncbi:transposase [Bacillus cereus HuB4-4]|uniref:Transposase n=2 Tax=Bacillus cereus TaxID=1396 RepID=A0A9W5QPU8_BACCE|nr:transposase [Bacillus cereus HuB4-4]
MEERGLSLSHTTIMRWVHQYGPALNKRIRKQLKKTNDSWRVDENHIKIKGENMYLYRAVDSEGNTLDFYLSHKRDAKAAKRFLKKALAFCHVTKPRVITVDGDKAYPVAILKLKNEKSIPHGMPIRMKQYLNNIIEQDHRFIKKRIRNMLGFKSWRTAIKMVKKDQLELREQSVKNQIRRIHQ